MALDTRDVTGNNFSASFNIGALSATANVPNIGNASALTSIPSSIQNDSDWSQGFGDGIGYGVSGSSTLVDLEMSLGQVASYFGIPTTFNISKWNGAFQASGTLIDATVGVEAGINYDASVALKPNVYAIVEGSADKHDIFADNMLSNNQFADTNNDGKISITVEADPIIAAQASASISTDVDAEAELLSASVSVDKWGINHSWNVGPLWQGGPWTIASNEFELVDLSKTISLSDIAPNLQSQLSTSFELPVA